MSPPAYTPTQNNVPVIFYQKQEYNASYPVPYFIQDGVKG